MYVQSREGSRATAEDQAVKDAAFLHYDKVLELTGFSRRTLNERILTEQITTYLDPQDRRRRMLSAEDVSRLVEVRPAQSQRRERVAA